MTAELTINGEFDARENVRDMLDGLDAAIFHLWDEEQPDNPSEDYAAKISLEITVEECTE